MVPSPTTEIPSFPTVPTPNGSLPFLSYTNGIPDEIWWSVKKVIVSFTLSTPPDCDTILPSNDISLFLFDISASNLAPAPFPPSNEMDNTFCISKFWGSTWISTTSPLTTGLMRAVVFPTPGEDTSKVGGVITS